MQYKELWKVLVLDKQANKKREERKKSKYDLLQESKHKYHSTTKSISHPKNGGKENCTYVPENARIPVVNKPPNCAITRENNRLHI